MYGISVLFSRVVRTNSVRHKGNSTKKLLEFLADMPKSHTGRIAETQKQRQRIAKKGEKYGPSSVYLQVLGSGARGAPNTLYLFTDQKRYLFNCGECTQRLAHEHKVKLSRLDHIFITSKTWRCIGGLPGLSLTLQDVGVPSITLHGPEGLDELYTATRRFVTMKEMNVMMAKCSPLEDFEDSVMSVKYVILGPNDEILKEVKPAPKRQKVSEVEKELEEFINDSTDYYQPGVNNFNRHTQRFQKDRVKPSKLPTATVADPIKKKTEKVLHELQKKSHCTVAYICSLKKRAGTLDLAKCVELGVKPGPMLGQLKNGHDVVLADGTLVFSKDVKTPDDPGPVFIVLDVPHISYLKETEFEAHFANGTNPQDNIPAIIVHFTPPDVFHDAVYQTFLNRFGPTTRHLILNTQNSCLGSEAVHRTQQKLHLLDPDIFPLLKDISVPAVWNAHPPIPKTNSPIRLRGLEELKNKIALAQFQNIINMESSHKNERPPSEEPHDERIELIAGRTLTMFHLRPKRQLDRSAEPKLHIQDYIQETMDVDGFVGSLEQFRRLVDSMRYARSGNQREFPKVVFLGTGSCIPSKTRNTSAIVAHIDENRSILLDCGEGTFGQLVRFYGPKRVSSFLRTLRAIYISHLHADHHIGLIGVLQARRQAYDEISCEVPAAPVYLLAPGQIISWLQVYDTQFERIKTEYTLVPNQNLVCEAEAAENRSAMLASIGVEAIETVAVPHCPNAFGVAITVPPYKITYSGDTLPCEALVKLGQNSTLLIHEATMEDELAEEARMKMHSTTTQAIEIGRQMQAKYTVLTHFSQRYARLPRLNANILNDNKSVGIAFDNMQITMADLDLLPHMYAPLQLMFAEHCVEMELKAAHRARQKQRAEARRSSPDLAEHAGSGRNCRGTPSMPLPRGYYRESHSSRLRAESKGVLGQSPMRCKTPRSKSQSPPRKASANLTPKSGNSGLSTPRSRCHSEGNSLDQALSTPGKSLSVSSSLKDVDQRAHAVDSATPIVDKDYEKFKNLVVAALGNLWMQVDHLAHKNKKKLIDHQSLMMLREVCETPSEGAIRLSSPYACYKLKARSKTLTTVVNRNERPESPPDNAKKSIMKSGRNSVTALFHRRPSTHRALPACVHYEYKILLNLYRSMLKARSKTMHSPNTRSERLETSLTNNKKDVLSTGEMKDTGYGKPLVTPTNKRLQLRKDVPGSPRSRNEVFGSYATKEAVVTAIANANANEKQPIRPLSPKNRAELPTPREKVSSLNRPKSPSYRTADYRRCHSSSVDDKKNLSKTMIPTKGVDSGNKLRASNKRENVNRERAEASPARSPVSVRGQYRLPSPGGGTKVAPSSQNRFNNNTSPFPKLFGSCRGRTQIPARKSASPPLTTATPAANERSRKENSPVRKSGIRPPMIHASKYQVSKTEVAETTDKIVTEKRSETFLKETVQTCKKPLHDKIKPIGVFGRPNNSEVHSVRSFKPQLEDIKSSFILLSKKQSQQKKENENKPGEVKNYKRKVPSDEERRYKILEVKKSFQTKKFWAESKYDKIEGLNWISWK